MSTGDTLQRWAAIATILAVAIALVALLRDIFDFEVPQPPTDIVAASGDHLGGAQGAPTAPVVPSDTTAPAKPTKTPEPPATAVPQPYKLEVAAASASSALAPEQIASGLATYEPAKAIDGDPASAWVEGVPGPGIGESLKLVFERPVTITRLGLDIGFDRDEAIFFENHRVRRARVRFSDGSEETLEFHDQRGLQYTSLNHTAITSITITIQEVFSGSRYDDTPIAEVTAWGYETP